jgi:hypothetical protein
MRPDANADSATNAHRDALTGQAPSARSSSSGCTRRAPPWCCEFGALGKISTVFSCPQKLPGRSEIGSVLQSICVSGHSHEFSDHNFEGVGGASWGARCGVSSEDCAACRLPWLSAQHMAQFGTVDRRMSLRQAVSARAASHQVPVGGQQKFIMLSRFSGAVKIVFGVSACKAAVGMSVRA